MRIKVKYLMWLRDKTGVESEEYFVENKLTISELIELIRSKHRNLDKLIGNIFSNENPIIILVNGIKRNPDYALSDDDEVVLLPPVSGG